MTATPTAVREVDVVIVGAGFGGLGLAIELQRRGETSFVVLERASDVGGTWRDNVYPGCACDIPSMLYSFSFAPNPAWTRTYPAQPEIWAYLRACVDRFGLRERIHFAAELVEAVYDEDALRWRVLTASGLEFLTRVLVTATGPLNKPAIPVFRGSERFAGPAFHSAQWDAGVDLRGKRIAVIGTGASAVQFVPQIAPLAAAVTVYQRTAPWIVPRFDRPVSTRRRRLRRLPGVAWAERQAIYWMLEARAFGFTVAPRVLRRAERLVLGHLRGQIPDPALRHRLTPDYRMGCKRILISDDYYPALRLPHVEVVTEPIRALTSDAVVTADGAERPADVVIYGTGFRATDGLGGVRIVGRGGRTLADAWRGGMSAYLGASVAGFPNFFTIIGPNTGLGHNSMVVMMEAQYAYILDALRAMRRTGVAAYDVRPEVQTRFNAALQRRMARTVWSTGCRSWYQDASGKNTTLWPGFTVAFRALTRRFRPACYEALAPGGDRR